MGIKERRERQKENLRQEILDAARELFVREGYDNVSMRKIAEKIEYSPTTIYLHFKDKAELLHQLCEETFAKLDRNLAQIMRDSDDPLTALRLGMRAYIDFGLKHPNHYEIVFISPLPQPTGPGLPVFEGSMGQQAFEHLRSNVAAAMAQGRLCQGDIDAVSQALWAALHGVTSLLIRHGNFPFVAQEVLIDCVIATMLRGLRP